MSMSGSSGTRLHGSPLHLAQAYEVKNFMDLEHPDSLMVILTIAGDSNLLLTGCHDHIVRVWDLESYQCLFELEGHTRSVMSMLVHENILITAATDRFIYFWDVSNHFKPICKVKLKACGNVFSMAITPDYHLVLGCQDTKIRSADISAIIKMAKLSVASSMTVERRSSATTQVNAMGEGVSDVHPELHWKIGTDHIGYVYSLAMHGACLFSGSGDSTIGVWDVTTLTIIKKLRGHTAPVNHLLIDNNQLFSCSQDCTIRTWDVDSLGCIRVLMGHNAEIVSLTVSSTHRLLFSGDVGGIIRIWDTKSFMCIKQLEKQNGHILCLYSFGNYFISAASDKLAKVWTLSRTDDPVSSLMAPPKSKPIAPFSWNLLEMLTELVSLPSISGDPIYKEYCWKCAKYLQLLLMSLGAEVRTVQSSTHHSNPCVIGRIGRDTHLPTVTFYGHYDVQPANKEHGWLSDPFVLQGRDGFIYGRGVSDNKGPILAFIHAIMELLEKNELRVNIVLCLEGEGEHGSIGFEQIVEDNLEMFDGTSLVLVSNNYWLGENEPCLTYGLRGQIQLSVTVTGAGTVMHSGVDGGLFPEALQDLVFLLAKLKDPLTQKVIVPGFYDNVSLESAEEGDLYKEIDFDLDRYATELGLSGDHMKRFESATDLLKQRWRNPSMTVHSIGTDADNTSLIPSVATALISIRVVPDQKLEDICNSFAEFIDSEFSKLGTMNRVSTKVTSADNWWLGDPFSEHYKTMADAITKVWGVKPLHVREGGTIRVSMYLEQLLGSRAIHFPMGQSSDRAHLDNERMRLRNLIKGKEVVKEFLIQLGRKSCPIKVPETPMVDIAI